MGKRIAANAANGELYISSVMHRSQLYAGLRRRQAAGRMNAGVAGVKDEDALHITFDSRRGEIEGK